jgi:hypothetical protein
METEFKNESRAHLAFSARMRFLHRLVELGYIRKLTDDLIIEACRMRLFDAERDDFFYVQPLIGLPDENAPYFGRYEKYIDEEVYKGDRT